MSSENGFDKGSYKININMGTHPSGIYFYTIITEYFQQTKRMVLLK